MNRRFRMHYTYRGRALSLVLVAEDEKLARLHFDHHYPHSTLDRVQPLSRRPPAQPIERVLVAMPTTTCPVSEADRERLAAAARHHRAALRERLFGKATAAK